MCIWPEGQAHICANWWVSKCFNTFVKKTVLSPFTLSGTFIKNKLTFNGQVYFWPLQSVPFTYMFTVKPTSFSVVIAL